MRWLLTPEHLGGTSAVRQAQDGKQVTAKGCPSPGVGGSAQGAVKSTCILRENKQNFVASPLVVEKQRWSHAVGISTHLQTPRCESQGGQCSVMGSGTERAPRFILGGTPARQRDSRFVRWLIQTAERFASSPPGRVMCCACVMMTGTGTGISRCQSCRE